MAIFFQGEKIQKKYQQIVSVVPSQTELLFDLGLNEEVIGITKFCVHPDEWFRKKTRVGGTKQLNIERIRSLQPDIVLANKEENLREEIEAIAAFTDVYVSDIEDLGDALQMIGEIGTFTGKIEEAELLGQQIENSFQLINYHTSKRAAYFIWKDPYMTVGGDTFIHDMMLHAGFENVFANEKRYPEISIEKLKALEPDIILLSSEPYPFKQKHIDELQVHIPAAKILLADGEMFSWYGSRLLKAPAYFKTLQDVLLQV